MIATINGQHFLVRGGCVSPYFPNVGVGRVMLGPMVFVHDSLVSLDSVVFGNQLLPRWILSTIQVVIEYSRRTETKNDWVVVSNICYFHPYLGKIPNLTHISQMGWNHQLDDEDLND